MSIGHNEQKDPCETEIGLGYTERKGRGGPELASVTFNGLTVVEPELVSVALIERAVVDTELPPVLLNGGAVMEPE